MRRNKLTSLLFVSALTAAEILGTGFAVYGADSASDSLEESVVLADESIEDETGKDLLNEMEPALITDDAMSDESLSADGMSVEYEAFDGIYYEAVEPDKYEEIGRDGATPVQTAEGVTEEMCDFGYWNDKTKSSGIGPDEVLITMEEIKTLNNEILAAKEANMYDIENLDDTYNADKLRENLVSGTTTEKTQIYADHVPVVPGAYYKQVADAIEATGYRGVSRQNQYAVAVKRTTINNIPVKAYIGYSVNDSDDEKASAALLVGEPFVIRQKATVFGDDFYWGYSDNCTGWVSAGDLAVCKDKSEWLDAWKTDTVGNDFIVVTQNQIILEPSVSTPELSQVKLTFATILKSVPEDKIPVSIAERGPWNNHAVYLPVRDENGNYVKKIALISQHYEVSRGFLKMTQAELLRVAFNNLGDRYGWGGMLDSMDCSCFTRNVYRCFGLQLPRNTTWQQAIPGRKIDLSGMSDADKLAAMSKMPAGTLFYLPGHTMIYTGTSQMNGQDMAYVISDSGSLSDTSGDLEVRSMYSVILNPLSVRRRNGTTWLSNITAAVLPISAGTCDFVRSSIEGMEPSKPVSINRVPAAEGQTYASSEDTLSLETFLGTSQNIFISFFNVEGSGVTELKATVIKGSKVTTKAPVRAVSYAKGAASWTRNKSTHLATVTLKKSGKVTFEMEDGKFYDVYFTVESPKARTKAVNDLLRAAKGEPSDRAVLSLQDLFGTRIDSGSLKITSIKKEGNASVFRNELMVNPKVKNTIKVSYKYLNKKYSITITVK
jgi:hypothetical protein